MLHRRIGALVAVASLLTLAACGSGSDDAARTAVGEQPATTGPPGDNFSEGENTQDAETRPPGGSTDPETVESTDVPTGLPTKPEAESAEVADTDPPSESAPGEPMATEAPATAPPAEPVVGGRLFAAEVQPAAELDSNPFPDLVVDDIGKDAEVNIRNILPSDRPVLLWAWAPH